MDHSAFVVEIIHDTGRWNENGSPILKKDLSHFDDLLDAVKVYNSHIVLGCFEKIRLKKFNLQSNRYDTLAVGDHEGSPSVLDYETVSTALSGRHTSQTSLEVF